MKVKTIMDLYSNWNSSTAVSDKDSEYRVTVNTADLADNKDNLYTSLLEASVMAVGFTNSELNVRVDLDAKELSNAIT